MTKVNAKQWKLPQNVTVKAEINQAKSSSPIKPI